MKTKSLCPECLKVIEAEIVKENNKVLLRKNCSEHGDFEDVYWSDARLYDKFEKFAVEGRGVENPNTIEKNGCPRDCGICPNHKTSTILANLDVTNRCNQKCPICFANAATAGYVFEPTFEEIRKMLETLRNEKPVPCPAVQFSGGEPTIRQDFPEIVKMARQMGFVQVQMASNGVTLAHNLPLVEKLLEAGLHTIYLQFDGLKKENYIKIRGYNALPTKLKAIENCRKVGFNSIVLVPTIAKGSNDDQIGDIIRFAIANRDVIRGINFQPVSFVGRINHQELRKMRITIPDVIKAIEEQTNGAIGPNDFYPIPFVVPISEFVETWTKKPQITFTIHPHCGAATYIFIDHEKIIPITRFIEVEELMTLITKSTNDLKKSIIKKLTKLRIGKSFLSQILKTISSDKAPTSVKFDKLFTNVLENGTKEELAKFHRNSIFLGIMHFQDAYNFDLRRVERCGIHYVVPDGRVIPFCSYNTIWREKIEKQFAKN